MVPETRYAKSGGVHVACQVLGEGPLDLVVSFGFLSHAGAIWDEPSLDRFLRRLASFSRLILFDKRGIGLSDPVPTTSTPILEQWMDDTVGGIAVHIGARVAAMAGAGEVLVSNTVKELVAGSGLRFTDRGTHTLKGVPGEWRLYLVES